VGLQISSRQSGDVTILDLRGRSTINDGECDLLNGQLQKLLASGVRKMVLNLTDLTQVDSSGLSVIATICASLRSHGGRLGFLRPRGPVLDVLRVLHLLEIIPSFEDEAEALASLGALRSVAEPT
jgi:anti-anti-sigma factor